ncbi:MAG: hypothetical protein KDA96_24380, partial [Planctomycetaceae bacterium]|nr:hypothetical protein [Planctomycetaceae bacterium]
NAIRSRQRALRIGNLGDTEKSGNPKIRNSVGMIHGLDIRWTLATSSASNFRDMPVWYSPRR